MSNNDNIKWYKDRNYILGVLTLIIVGLGGLYMWGVDRYSPINPNPTSPTTTVEQGNNSTYNENPIIINNNPTKLKSVKQTGKIELSANLEMNALKVLDTKLNQKYSHKENYQILIETPTILEYLRSGKFYTQSGVISFNIDNSICYKIKVDKTKLKSKQRIIEYFNDEIQKSFNEDDMTNKLLQCLD